MSTDCEAVRILIADDHPVVREGVRRVLQAEPDLVIVGEAADGSEAVGLAMSLRPDVLLVDLAMPRLSGLEVLRDVAAQRSPVRVIVLTASIKREEIIEALHAGARGVVLKDAPINVLSSSIRAVMKGQYWVARELFANLADALFMLEMPKRQTGSTFGLTPRQLEVVANVVEGLSNKEIASRLSISKETVKHHLSEIFDKVGVSNRVELALFATHHRLGV
jgi:two-component system, NarL family, nitrate/nitrite response regulator NarL